MKTPAVLFTGKNQVEFGEVEVPDPGPNDVMIRTTHSWISNGTEMSFLIKDRWDGITPWRAGLPEPFPIVPGYQRVGVIESLGDEVEGFEVGQTVFSTIAATVGTHLGFGGHLHRGPSNAAEVYPLPEGDDPVQYSGLVLTQVGYNSASRPPVEGEPFAMVIGDGMVGQWAAQTLQARGAKVAMIGMMDFRLNLFNKREGDLVLSARDPKWLVEVAEWAGGEFDIVVDTVGNDVNFDTNIKLVPMMRWGGHFVMTGHMGHKFFMDLREFIYRECTIHCPCAWTRQRMETTRDWIHEGKLKTLPLITDRMNARDVGEAWDKIRSSMDTTLGIVLDWDNI